MKGWVVGDNEGNTFWFVEFGIVIAAECDTVKVSLSLLQRFFFFLFKFSRVIIAKELAQ